MKKAAYFGAVETVPYPNTEAYATMHEATADVLTFPSSPKTQLRLGDDPLTDILRRGARQLLTQAVEAEVQAWIDDHAHVTDEYGRRQVVRNGQAQPRKVVTGLGPIEVAMPRVHDRRSASPEGEARERFTSSILPPYLRKARSIEQLLPWLYLKGGEHRRLQRIAGGIARPGLPGPVGFDHRAS